MKKQTNLRAEVEEILSDIHIKNCDIEPDPRLRIKCDKVREKTTDSILQIIDREKKESFSKGKRYIEDKFKEHMRLKSNTKKDESLKKGGKK